MKKIRIIVITLILLNFGDLYSQNVTDSLLVDFLNKTFNDYFTNRQIYDTSRKNFYIYKNSTILDSVKTDYSNFKLHLIEKQEELYPLIKKNKNNYKNVSFLEVEGRVCIAGAAYL